MRLFFGIELPEPLRSEVGRVQSLLRPAGADVRWVDPEIAHVTLKFLGELDPNEIPPVDEAVGALPPVPRCRVGLRGVGVFPRRGAMRVVWAGLEGEIAVVRRLHENLEGALAPLGFRPDRRPFRPHVTLGRVRGRGGQRSLRQRIERHAEHELGRWTVRRFVLFESELRPEGPRYEVAATYPLS